MCSFSTQSCIATAALCLGMIVPGLAQQQSIDARSNDGPSPHVDSVDLDVLMRGPVHEGFAEPATNYRNDDPTREMLELPEPIPEAINELPAQGRPYDERREAIWLPGYWGVEDADQLCWVSGTWRYAPPGMQWVPGYWAETGAGQEWIAGFWVQESAEQIAYLPTPPPYPEDVVDYGDVRSERFWVPGNHHWDNGEYRWVDGFWSRAQPNWVWVPQRLVPTPRGYIQISGYWDYPIDRRGTLFAPVRFASQFDYRQTYRPNVALNLTQALVSWFVRPSYGHYYFGNYYGDRYRSFGIQPWAAYSNNVNHYDPLYAYYSTSRSDFLQGLVRNHRRVISDGNFDLPTTYAQYRNYRGRRGQQTGFANLARSVDELVSGDRVEGFDNLRQLNQFAGDNLNHRFEQQADSLRRFARGRRDAELRSGGLRDTVQRGPDESDRRDRDDRDREGRGNGERGDDGRGDDGRKRLEERREALRDQGGEGLDRGPENPLEDRRDELQERREDLRKQLQERREPRQQRGGTGEQVGDANEQVRQRLQQAAERAQNAGDNRVVDPPSQATPPADVRREQLQNRVERMRQSQRQGTQQRLGEQTNAARPAAEQPRQQQQGQQPTGDRFPGRSNEAGQRSREGFDMRPFRNPAATGQGIGGQRTGADRRNVQPQPPRRDTRQPATNGVRGDENNPSSTLRGGVRSDAGAGVSRGRSSAAAGSNRNKSNPQAGPKSSAKAAEKDD